MSSDSTAEGRAALVQYHVKHYDRKWFVDHETTVDRWDNEMSSILQLGCRTARPIDDDETAIWVIHLALHELIEMQGVAIQVDPQGAMRRELLQMIALRSLWEAIQCSGYHPMSELDEEPWVNGDACKIFVASNRELMVSKNRQYGSSWSVQRSSDMTGTIHAKVHRITQLLSGEQNTFESIEDSYRDIINYAIFCLIRMSMEIGSEAVVEEAEFQRLIAEMTPDQCSELEARLAEREDDQIMTMMTP